MQSSGRVSRNKRQSKHWDEGEESFHKQHRKFSKPHSRLRQDPPKYLEH
jgi:hypothetical protein